MDYVRWVEEGEEQWREGRKWETSIACDGWGGVGVVRLPYHLPACTVCMSGVLFWGSWALEGILYVVHMYIYEFGMIASLLHSRKAIQSDLHLFIPQTVYIYT